MKDLPVIPTVLLCFGLTTGFAAQEAVTISEFMASNTRILTDEDGESVDWIEIHNSQNTRVNLDGWYLTDSAGDLRKWRFPATNLNAGAFLLVYASNKDRHDPGRPLHTNFKLSQNGSYLALVKPDGTNIATAFAPEYPPQVPNLSYGFGVQSTNVALMPAGAGGRVLVPSVANGGATLSDGWRGANSIAFNDSTWAVAAGAIGFSVPGKSDLVAGSNLVLRLNFDSNPVNNVIVDSKPGGTIYNGVNRGADWVATMGDASALPRVRTGVMQFVAPSGDQITVPGNADFGSTNGAVSFWMRSGGKLGTPGGVLMDRRSTAPTGLIIVQSEDGRIFAEASQSSTVQLANFAITQSSVGDDRWHLITCVYNGAADGGIAIYIDGRLEVSSPNSASWGSVQATTLEIGRSHVTTFQRFGGALDDFRMYNRSLSSSEVRAIYDGDGGPDAAAITTDLQAALFNVNASAFLRVPFVVTNPSAISSLQLRLQYDDGYAAWINGVEVGRVNTPDVLDWNSAATNTHSSSFGEELLIVAQPGLLKTGTNILAIQGLNLSAADPSFFLGVDLSANLILGETELPMYFTSPTPGDDNDPGVQLPGPAISDAKHTPNVPRDQDDLIVTTRVAPTFAALTDIVLHYRVMFDAEATMPMLDDGKHGDGAAGDGVFGATIPSTVSTNSQMVRYYITATDAASRASRWPLFLDKLASAEYFGTVVNPDYVSSKLPIFHFYVAANQLSRIDAQGTATGGGRASVFFDGEFYDNVDMQLRGNSTAGFLKKSHRVNFNREHKLQHPGPGGRIRKTSFVADYPDPTYMRQGLSYWLCDLLGAPAPFYYPVRLQMNGQFYQLANHNDVHGEEFLERIGFDPNGALYNAAGQVTPTKDSTGGFEKKTRTWQDDADYVTLARAIRDGQAVGIRKTNLFDLFDLPEMISYMVAARFVNENDDVWANMSLYHDNDGDGLWRIIPFDMNLSWGAAFLDGAADDGIQATNDNHKSFPMYGSSQALSASSSSYNRMYDIIFSVPETKDMYLRRVRTFLDTWILPPGAPTNSTLMEKKILAWRDLIAEEADRDRAKWKWPAKGGQSNFDPGIGLYDGVSIMLEKFFYERRAHYYVKHSVLNTALPVGIRKNQNAGIPTSQPADAMISVLEVDTNPSSGNQGHEYICLTNANPYAVDISGWEIKGGVSFTFQPGTVMSSNSVLYLSPDINAFATRTTAPKRGMGLYVIGNYKGQLSARGEALQIVSDTGRLVNTFTVPGNPTAAQKSIRITEIMYHPVEGADGQDSSYEYIEIKNIGTSTVDLSGMYFSSGIELRFVQGVSLAAGASRVLVANPAAFQARYGAATGVGGWFLGALNNGGDHLTLNDASGEVVHDVDYNNSWYPITDGLGFSLVAVDESKAPNLWDSTNWRSSSAVGGSPGVANPAPLSVSRVVINEVMSNPTVAGNDSVELHNRGTTPADVSGWFLTDDFTKPKKYKLPAGSVIGAGGYLNIPESAFNPAAGGSASFALDAGGDSAWIFSADAAGNLTGYVHGFQFGAAESAVPFGRYVTSTGAERFVAQVSATPGATNSGPRIGPVVISEINYHPPGGSNDEDARDEFIEIRNRSTAAVGLFDPAHPTNSWRLQGGIGFTFPTNLTLSAGEGVLIVNFDPATNTVREADFRSRLNVRPGVRLFGPYSGRLSNQGETVRLTKPNSANADGDPRIKVDEVVFNDSIAWAQAADGWGASLQRIKLDGYGNDPINWTAASPSPGALFVGGGLPVITQQPVSAMMAWLHPVTLRVTATGAQSYQWLHNGEAIPGATESEYNIPFPLLTDSGVYNVVVLNPAGALLSSNAIVNVGGGSYFVVQPRNRGVLTGSNASFNVAGYGTGTLKYQWKLNGFDLPGQTATNLILSNLQTDSKGRITVAVTDDTGTTVSEGANLMVVAKPVIGAHPQSLTVLEGQNATFNAVASGTTPMSFRWRKGTVVLTNMLLNQSISSFTLTNVTLAQAGVYNVQITNIAVSLANAASVTATSTDATLTVLADTDRDGIPDDWETQFGLNPRDPSDALLDTDKDGVANRDEYLGGTSPNEANTPLRIVVDFAKPSNLTLAFQAAANRTYAVQFRDNVASGPWTLLKAIDSLPNARTETLAELSTNKTRFYRVVSPAPIGVLVP